MEKTRNPLKKGLRRVGRELKNILTLCYSFFKKKKSVKFAQSLSTGAVSKNNNRLINVAVIGAGEFAQAVHLPNLTKLDNLYNIYAVLNRTDNKARNIAKQFGAAVATTSYDDILGDANVDMVLICTRHNLHVSMAIKALKAGKSVFLEKPMALNEEELNDLARTIKETNLPFTVGFNRRYSQFVQEVKKVLEKRKDPVMVYYRINAKCLSKDHWLNTDAGGGRIIGHACHVFDLFTYLTESTVREVSVSSLVPQTEKYLSRDNISVTLTYEEGSICALLFTSLGNSEFSKDYCEIFVDGKVFVIDDYKKLTGWGVDVHHEASVQQKGYLEELIAFGTAINENELYTIPLEQLIETTRITFEVDRQVRSQTLY